VERFRPAPVVTVADRTSLGRAFAILEAVARHSQVVVATQSVTLLNQFSPGDVIVAENDGLQSTFNHVDEEKLKDWLNEFSIGELWEKNVLGGRP